MLSSLRAFSHLLLYPQANWALLELITRWVVCVYSRTLWVGLSSELSCETGSFSRHHNPHRFLQPVVLRLSFLSAGTLGCAVCLTPQLFPPVFPHTNVGRCCQPAATSPSRSSSQLPVSAPPTGLDECFFCNSLVVGLPYSSIFWQFWLFFVLNFRCPSFGCSGRQSVSTYASILARSSYLFIFKERGREGGREKHRCAREKHQLVVSRMPQTGDLD